jgi:hypothetical protein
MGGTVRTLALKGSTLYAGGDFTIVNATVRNRLAALDTSTGLLIPAFNPNIGSSSVCGLALNGSILYVGGFFYNAGAVPSSNYAAIAVP